MGGREYWAEGALCLWESEEAVAREWPHLVRALQPASAGSGPGDTARPLGEACVKGQHGLICILGMLACFRNIPVSKLCALLSHGL